MSSNSIATWPASLAERLGAPEGLTIHQADALAFDFCRLATARPVRVIGNLPYNISTPLIFHLLDQSECITDMVFMLQKEVVDRLVAAPGSRQYGRLSVMAGFYCTMSHLFDVGPDAFDPPPKVDSAIIRMLPRTVSDTDRALLPDLDVIVRTGFGQRRKTLRKSLSKLLDADQIESVGIDPAARPETLGLEEFKALARVWGGGGGRGRSEVGRSSEVGGRDPEDGRRETEDGRRKTLKPLTPDPSSPPYHSTTFQCAGRTGSMSSWAWRVSKFPSPVVSIR
jgi:16S rRNA (adenine1518-N6/adenine1519-N6)-dimethyltransferase